MPLLAGFQTESGEESPSPRQGPANRLLVRLNMRVGAKTTRTTTSALLMAAAVCLLAHFPSPLAASDPLAIIPADMPAVLVFRDLQTCAGKFETFARKIDEDFGGLDLDEIQRGFNLPDGVVDTSAPIFLILTRTKVDEGAFVLAFKPRDLASFSAEDAHQAYLIRDCTGPEGSYRLMVREEWVLVSQSRLALRALRHVPAERSLARVLDDRQKAIMAESNLFLYVPLSRWRERIQPFVFLGTHLIKLGALAESEPGAISDMTLAVLDWFADGARTIVGQMDSLSVGASFDGETFRLTHHHAFAPGQSVADYLKQVRRRGYDWPGGLPDRPFFVIGGFDWRCPPELSLSGKFNEYVFTKNPAIARKLSPETRQRLLDSSRICYGRMWGSFFMVTSPAGELRPMQVFGGYAVDDAADTIKHLVYLQEHAGEVMGVFTGEQVFGKFEARPERGRPFYEMRFDLQNLSPDVRRQFAGFYGDEVRIQQTVLDADHIVYATAAPPAGVDELLTIGQSGDNIGQNPDVRRILSRLPKDANGIVVVDMGRCLAAMPAWVNANRPRSADGPSAEATISAAWLCPETPGPMIGWACTVQQNWIAGCLAVDADDAVRLLKMARKMVEDVPVWNAEMGQ